MKQTCKKRRYLKGGESPTLNECFHAHIGKHFLGFKNSLTNSTTNVKNLTVKANDKITTSINKIKELYSKKINSNKSDSNELVQKQLEKIQNTSNELSKDISKDIEKTSNQVNKFLLTPKSNTLTPKVNIINSNNSNLSGGKKRRIKKRRTKKRIEK